VPIEEKFKKLGLIVNHSTSVMLNLHNNGFLRFEPLPLESGEQTSSTWRALCDDLPKVDFDASHIYLMKKVDTLIGKLGVQNTDIRFWLDKGHHKESELYPDLVLSQTPTKKSESKNLRRQLPQQRDHMINSNGTENSSSLKLRRRTYSTS
jgi:hypothetical protein